MPGPGKGNGYLRSEKRNDWRAVPVINKRFFLGLSLRPLVVLVFNVDVFFIIYYCLSLAEGGNEEGREADGKVKAWGNLNLTAMYNTPGPSTPCSRVNTCYIFGSLCGFSSLWWGAQGGEGRRVLH